MTAGGTLAIFESLTGGEVIMISVFALVVLGPERLPEVARSAGEWITRLKQLASNLQGEMQEVMDDPAMQPIREVGEFVAQPRKKLSEIVANADADSSSAAAARLEEATPDAAPESPTADGSGEEPAANDASMDVDAQEETVRDGIALDGTAPVDTAIAPDASGAMVDAPVEEPAE